MPPHRPFWIRHAIPLSLSLVVGGLLAWVAARGGVPLVPSRAAFRSIEPWAIPAYVLTLGAVVFVRAARWRFLIAPIKRIPLSEVLRLNVVGFLAIFLLPFRLGEAARPTLTKLRHGVPISAGVGTVAVERVIDGIVTSLCVAYALFALPMRETTNPVARALPGYGLLALAVFTAAFAALFLFLWQRALAVRLCHAILDLVSRRLADTVTEKLASMADGLRILHDPKLAAGFLGETLLYWGLNAFGMWVLARGTGLPLDFGHAVGIMGILAIGILLPAGPGLFGSFQLAVAAGLECYLPLEIVEREGSLYIFLLYGLQALVTLVGLVPLFRLHIGLDELLGESEGGSAEAASNLRAGEGSA